MRDVLAWLFVAVVSFGLFVMARAVHDAAKILDHHQEYVANCQQCLEHEDLNGARYWLQKLKEEKP